MRVFTASLATETNTFSPVPTDRASFEMAFYAGPGKHPETPTLCSSPIVALRRRAAKEGLTVIEGTATWAEPGFVSVTPGRAEIMMAPVSVCHHVSTIGADFPPMILRYHIHASGLIGSPTEPSSRREERSNCFGTARPIFMKERIAVGAV